MPAELTSLGAFVYLLNSAKFMSGVLAHASLRTMAEVVNARGAARRAAGARRAVRRAYMLTGGAGCGERRGGAMESARLWELELMA